MPGMFGGAEMGKPIASPPSMLAKAPRQGLKSAMAPAPSTEAPPEPEQTDPEDSPLGTRLPKEPFSALIDVVRRFGRVY